MDDVLRLEGRSYLWLNAIKTGFLSEQLQKINLKSWRLGSGKVAKWSGLSDGDPLPRFQRESGDIPTAKQPKIEIRFETLPIDLPKNSIEYRISVRSGDEELAYREVSHQDKRVQAVRLTNEDFQDLPEDSQFEAQIRVEALGNDDCEAALSEEFLITFGQSDQDSSSSNAKRRRSLIEGAIDLPELEAFDTETQTETCFFPDNKGFIVFRPTGGKTSYKVMRPPLIELIDQLQAETPPIGRWCVRVRADGTRVASPTFHECNAAACTESTWEKLLKATQRFRDETSRLGGFWGRIYSANLSRSEEYVNAWASAIEESAPEFAIANTIEVQSLGGRTIGLIVLPSHPLRVAWHMAFDQLARHARYSCSMPAKEVCKALDQLDSSHFPAMLPGISAGA